MVMNTSCQSGEETQCRIQKLALFGRPHLVLLKTSEGYLKYKNSGHQLLFSNLPFRPHIGTKRQIFTVSLAQTRIPTQGKCDRTITLRVAQTDHLDPNLHFGPFLESPKQKVEKTSKNFKAYSPVLKTSHIISH